MHGLLFSPETYWVHEFGRIIEFSISFNYTISVSYVAVFFCCFHFQSIEMRWIHNTFCTLHAFSFNTEFYPFKSECRCSDSDVSVKIFSKLLWQNVCNHFQVMMMMETMLKMHISGCPKNQKVESIAQKKKNKPYSNSLYSILLLQCIIQFTVSFSHSFCVCEFNLNLKHV